MSRSLIWHADKGRILKKRERQKEVDVFGVGVSNTLDVVTHFPNQAEIIILINVQLDSLFYISSLSQSRPLFIQEYL